MWLILFCIFLTLACCFRVPIRAALQASCIGISVGLVAATCLWFFGRSFSLPLVGKWAIGYLCLTIGIEGTLRLIAWLRRPAPPDIRKQRVGMPAEGQF